MRPARPWELGYRDPADQHDAVGGYPHADFPHDNWWAEGTLTFSDGSTEGIPLTKSYDPQNFKIEKKGITRLKLGNLIKADDPSPFPALTQIEVYGTDSK